jgi:hypothetical protein
VTTDPQPTTEDRLAVEAHDLLRKQLTNLVHTAENGHDDPNALVELVTEQIFTSVVEPFVGRLRGSQAAHAPNLNELSRLRRLEQWLIRHGAPGNTEEMLDWLALTLEGLRDYRAARQYAANAGVTIREVVDRYVGLCRACRQGSIDVTGVGKPPHSEHVPGPWAPPADVPPPTGKFLDGYR